jgi:prepilin-type N-terminal cleavage/methylation domain-containing protein
MSRHKSRGIGYRSAGRAGFTLVELLVVIAIIGVLVSLLLPAVQAAREAARRTQCSNNIRQIGVALHNYHDTAGRFPPGGIHHAGGPAQGRWENGSSTSWRASWLVLLLPFLEREGLHSQFNFGIRARDSAENLEVVRTVIPTFVCPSTGSQKAAWQMSTSSSHLFAKGNYGACFSAGSAFSQTAFSGTRMDWERAVFNAAGHYGAQMADIKDGSSNVIAVSEILTRDSSGDGRGAWAYPTGSFFSGGNQDPNCTRDDRLPPNGIALDNCFRDKPAFCNSNNNDPQLRCIAVGDRPNIAARSYHPGGVHAMLADGSVKFINDQIAIETWTRLLCLHDGEPVGQY